MPVVAAIALIIALSAFGSFLGGGNDKVVKPARASLASKAPVSSHATPSSKAAAPIPPPPPVSTIPPPPPALPETSLVTSPSLPPAPARVYPSKPDGTDRPTAWISPEAKKLPVAASTYGFESIAEKMQQQQKVQPSAPQLPLCRPCP